MHVVTTMNKKVYEDFGYRLLDSLKKHAPVRVLVYSEDDSLLKLVEDRYGSFQAKPFDKNLGFFLDSIDSNEKVGFKSVGLKKIERFLKTLLRHGSFDYQSRFYDFLYDSRRFSFKSFAYADALINISDHIMYLDADCHLDSNMPVDDLEAHLLQASDYAFFGRDTFTETGILYFNNSDLRFQKFGLMVQDMYLSGAIYDLDKWTDCHVFDYVRNYFSKSFVGRNLNPNPSDMHPIATSMFSDWIDHRKGPRKHTLGSLERAKDI